jgi:hypothetical protein
LQIRKSKSTPLFFFVSFFHFDKRESEEMIRSGRFDEADPRIPLDIESGLPDIGPVAFDEYRGHGEGNVGTDRDRHRGIKVLCKHWLRGLCKKEGICEFLHEYDLSKMPQCYFFIRFNSCTSDTCQYLHTVEENGNLDCPRYARGFCRSVGILGSFCFVFVGLIEF